MPTHPRRRIQRAAAASEGKSLRLSAQDLLLRLQRVARADAVLQVATAATATELADLFQAISRTPAIPARVIAVDAEDVSTPQQLCQRLQSKHTQADNTDSSVDAVLAVLNAQRQRGGRTMLVTANAQSLTDESIDLLSHLTRSGGLHAVLIGTQQIVERIRNQRITHRWFQVVNGEAPSNNDAPIFIDRMPEPVAETHHAPEPVASEHSTSPVGPAPTQTQAATVASNHYRLLIIVALAALVAGLIIGWYGNKQFQPAANTAIQPQALPPAPEPYQLIKAPPLIQPDLQVRPTSPRPPIDEPVERTELTQATKELTGTHWLLAQDPEHYTVQLLAMQDRAGLQWGLDTYGAVPGVQWYHAAMDDGSERFVLLYGLFDSHSEATRAVAELPEALQSTSPWVRSIRLLQAQATRAPQ